MPIKHSGLPPEKWIAEAQKMLRQLPAKVANTAHRHFARNFETESWEGQKWPPRSPWAVRNDGRQLLRDTGTLYRALSKEVSGSRIRIYIAPPADKYADIHNQGGTITIPPNKGSMAHFWRMYYAAPSGVEKSRWKAMALAMRAGKSIKVKIHKRQFIGESKQLEKKIYDLLEKEITKLNNL